MLKKILWLIAILAGCFGCGSASSPSEGGEAQIPQDATLTSSADDAQLAPDDAPSVEDIRASSEQALSNSCTPGSTKWVKEGCCANGKQRYRKAVCAYISGRWQWFLPLEYKCGTNACPM
jgi:hypothetical protein